MKITKYTAVIAIGLMCFAGQASAMDGAFAQVSAMTGSVAVNSGGAYTPAVASKALGVGDRVVSMDGASAQIKYADGCVVNVKADSMATVGATSPCAASGLVGKSAPMDFNSMQGFWGALAVFAVGGILIAVYASSKDDDHNPVSP
jgi:hypothetical protein